MKIHNGTVLIDLSKSEEELWNEVDKDNRWSVNKARKEGIIVKEDGDKKKCYKLYLVMCNHNQLIPMKEKDLFSIGKLFAAWKGDKVVSFAIVHEDKDKATLGINASDYEYRNTQANSLLYWDFIMYYKKLGYKIMNLGGVDLHAKITEGIDKFKIKWGGKLVEKSSEVSFFEYVWWRYLRHYNIFRSVKHRIQTVFLRK